MTDLLTQDYIAKLKTRNALVVCLGSYKNNATAIPHRCTRCSHKWNAVPNSLLSARSACPKCANNVKFSDTDYAKRLRLERPDVTAVGNYSGMATPIQHKCLKCGGLWMVKPGNIIHCKSKCPTCSRKLKTIALGRRTVRVQGYEPQAIAHLLSKGFKPGDLKVSNEGSIPVIPTVYGKRIIKHKPDIFVPKKNTLYEVKSPSTMGLVSCRYNARGSVLFRILKAKYRSAVRLGYKYQVILVDGTKVWSLPSRWWEMNHHEIKVWWQK